MAKARKNVRKKVHKLPKIKKSGQVAAPVQKRSNREVQAAAVLPLRERDITGRLQTHARGFGFVEDIYIAPENMRGAMHNDQVVVRLKKREKPGGRLEGEVIRILERANRRVVGTYYRVGKWGGTVTPDDPRLGTEIQVAKEDTAAARSGDKVVVEVTRWPDAQRGAEGRIQEVLGASDAPGVDVLSIVRRYELPDVFPKKVKREVKRVPLEVEPEEMNGRYDLRSWPIVTIDGEDAKDLDDAVSLHKLANGNYLLGVHIADVSHYVREDTALDREAMRRGTSVYLVDRVIPMLPPELSNGICSLNPRVDRLAVSVFMEIDPQGARRAYGIVHSVIRTAERMTYTAVRQILEGGPEAACLRERYGYLEEDFFRMRELAEILRSRRKGQGSLDFDLPECRVGLDEQGRPVDLYRYPRSIADIIIEEFMLAANETIAWHLFRNGLPAIYRIHEDPDPARLEELRQSLAVLGYSLPAEGRVSSHVLQEILEKVEGRPEERVVNTLVLRSLKRARYAPQPVGHFGLAMRFYTHFTSPIRRYPDLVVHRVLQKTLPAEGFFFPSYWRPQPAEGLSWERIGPVGGNAERVEGAASAAAAGDADGSADLFLVRPVVLDEGGEVGVERPCSGGETKGVEYGEDKVGKSWRAEHPGIGAGNGEEEVGAENGFLSRLQENLPQIADHASERERIAEEAERESVEMKKVEYMQQFLGEIFTGVVSGVTPFGMFVELENLVEGLVHVASLTDDYYEYVETPPSLVGTRTRRRWRIGDAVTVQVVRVSVEQRQVDFVLVEGENGREQFSKGRNKNNHRKS